MLHSPIFWLMFVMMTLMSTSGLMVTSQMAAFATDFGVAKAVVWGLAALPLALTIDRFTNGLTRPFFGWVSDPIGRENTMCLAFALEAVAMALWLATRGDPLLFVLLSGVVFFGWGEIFSLFPSTLTDTFGAQPRRATTAACTSRRASARSSAARWRRCCTMRPAPGRPSSSSPRRRTCSPRCWRSSS